MVASTNPLSTPEHIGATARILSNLTELPLEKLIVKQLGNKAVLNTGQQAPDTKLLAGALREALGKSGLFYESHQAQWIRGERSMNQLLEEPQNVLTGKSSLPSPNNEQRAVSVAQTSSNMPVTSDSADDTSLPIAKELLSLVQQQLHTLEHHHLAWMGQVWPGQEIQWEIKGQPEHQPQQQDERQWSTEIELALPKLGNVHARLVFTESGLQLTLNAADTVTVDLFNRTLPQLRNSLADADIALTTALVEKS